MSKKNLKRKIVIVSVLIMIPLISILMTAKIYNEIDEKKVVNVARINNVQKWKSKIEGLNIYTVQMGYLKDYEKVKLVEKDLDENQIPNYVIQKDGYYKIYSYTLCDEDKLRKLLVGLKENYTDAFISKIKVSGLDMEFTEKYSCLGEFAVCMNNYLQNIKKESDFWYNYNLSTSNYSNYIEIINQKKKLVESLTSCELKMDKEETKYLKKELQNLTNALSGNITNINLNLGKNNMYSCEKLYLESVFNYYNFINGLKNKH